jgi:hypothetical protein
LFDLISQKKFQSLQGHQDHAPMPTFNHKHNRKQGGTTKADVVFPLPETLVTMPDGYPAFIRAIKEKLQRSASKRHFRLMR